ncbi:MAG TPA: hypothetical protein VFA46_22415 [Actinomycetes bacterium]|nr:hypothetical protein [Actinomycetes bacterium]
MTNPVRAALAVQYEGDQLSAAPASRSRWARTGEPDPLEAHLAGLLDGPPPPDLTAVLVQAAGSGSPGLRVMRAQAVPAIGPARRHRKDPVAGAADHDRRGLDPDRG